MKKRTNAVSKAYSGNKTFGYDAERGYLFIYAEAACTIELGQGGGKVPIPVGGFFEPYIIPSSEFTVESAGNYVVVTTESTHSTVT